MARIAEENRDIEQVARLIRAQVQGRDFLFVRDGEKVRCLGARGKEYEIAGGVCSCEDFTYRCAAANLRCKHLCALEAAEERGEVH